ncbi:MAG TPA: hypothetical protein PLZ51_07485, partial [Aggregatilineales bacterium]|nr:hypothetical protein [Aggregatilineales bacterium]
IPADVTNQPLPTSPVIASAEPDYYVTALQSETVPDDPFYHQQWALPLIGMPRAWQEIPADSPIITVAVIDSGICAEHPDLIGRIVAGYDFVD